MNMRVPLQAEDALGVLVEDLLHDGIGIAEFLPFLENARIG
jgi:hypothetical protein